jgi:argininosuccinate lyase
VALCESSGRQLHQLTDSEFVQIHPSLLPDVREVLTVHGALASRTTKGGTSPSSFATQMTQLQESISNDEKKFNDKQKAFSAMMGQ